jgi:hypothetical protein
MMSKEEYLAIAESKYEALQKLQEEGNFYDYEKSFDALWVEFGRQVLEKSISSPSKDHRKKTLAAPATAR